MTKNKCLRILNNHDNTDDSPRYGQVSIEKKNHYSWKISVAFRLENLRQI